MRTPHLTLMALLSLPAGMLFAAETSPEGIDFFERKIRPVLAENCYECHSVEGGKQKGGLLLDSRESIRAGGDSGPAVVPGDAAESLLLTAVSHTDPDLKMPPKKPQLAASAIGDLKTWITMGAPDPREEPTAKVESPPVTVEAGRAFWAFQKPVAHPVPKTSDPAWATREMDHFILAKLDAEALTPSPDAEPAILLRRLHFDLVGLPPSPRDIRRFESTISARGLEAAIEEQVDDLLASDQFGERWGRHWLDVARFAESNGRESNLTYPHAWRYRDYVIDSFNDDTPFNRFLVEQIAGDLLPWQTDAERADLLVATGFLAMGAKGLNEMNRLQFLADLADEQLDTVTRAVMASSVACARCHDHKFDPFSMTDYYALAGIFISSKTFFGTAIGSENNIGGDLIQLPDLDGQLIPNQPMPPEKVAKMKEQVAALNQEEKDGKAALMKAIAERRNPEGVFTLEDALRILWVRGGLEGQLKTVDDRGGALPLAMGVLDHDEIRDVPLLERGEIDQPGKEIARGFPRVIEIPDAETPGAEQSGRLEFAHWLTSPEHPLTARVMANRVWRYLIGEGIVPTVDNFGFNGEKPSHPELLDHLALSFVDSDWSVKSLVREIVLSRTYRQASTFRRDYFEKDPDNRLLWRANKRRLDAEAIRDAMLSASGLLDTSRRPASLVAEVGDKSVSLFGFTKTIPADLDGSRHRSVYLPVVRDRLPDVLELFDFAEPSLVTGDRETTNVPLQALYLMNSSFVQEQAAALAGRVGEESPERRKQIRNAFLLCFGRAPEAGEIEFAEAYFDRGGGGESADAGVLMKSFCQSLLAAAEFRNVD